MKFRRKSDSVEEREGTVDETAAPLDVAADDDPGEEGVTVEVVTGPRDVEEVADDGVDRIDLGSLLIEAQDDRELRIQVDDATQTVQSVVLAGPDGAVELRAFAAPRHGDLWSEIRPKLAADMARRGGTATEREGAFGTELVCNIQVRTAEGQAATQPSRIVGINGSRWMLRATFLGRPAVDDDVAATWEETIARVVVRRGDHAMPVGDALPILLPSNARRATPPTS